MGEFTYDYDLLNQTNLPQLVNQALYKLFTSKSKHYQVLKTQIDIVIDIYASDGLIKDESQGYLTLKHMHDMAHCNTPKPALYHGDFIPKIKVADAEPDAPLLPVGHTASSGSPIRYEIPSEKAKCERAIQRAWQNLHDLYIHELEDDAERLQQATMHTPSLGWCEALSEAVGCDDPMPRKQAEKERLIALRTRALQSQREIVAKMAAKYNALCDQYEHTVRRAAAMAFSFKKVDLPKAYNYEPQHHSSIHEKTAARSENAYRACYAGYDMSMNGAQKRRPESASCFARLCC